MSKKQVKLEKSLKPINVWSLALGSIIGWGCFVMPGDSFLKTAGPLGTAIGMSIGALIMIIISLSYGYMVQRFPVTGGEFAFAFKGFGRNHAFICAWFLGLSYLSIVPLNATALGLIGRYLFPGVMQRGYLYSIAGWDIYLGEVLFATAAIIIFSIISIRGMNVAGWLQTVMTFALVGSIILLSIVAFISPKTSIENLQPVFTPGSSPIKGILAVVAVAPWAYVGFGSIPQAAEEFNFSPKKSTGLMIGAIIFGGMMYIAMNTVTAIAFPWNEFISGDPLWATGMAVEHLMGKIGLLILGIALLTAILAGILGFYMATSRLLLSMARAKALPEWFGVVDERYKTPSNAIKFVLIISMIAPWFGRQVLTWVVDMASIGAAIGYLYTCASAFRFLIKEKGKITLKIMSILGAMCSVGFIILLITPGMPSYLSLPSRILLIIWCILGVSFYAVSGKEYKLKSDKELERYIFE